MKNSKKFISLALCLAMLLSMITCLGTISVSAASEASGYRYLEYGITYWYSSTGTTGYTSGSGTQADPFIVTTAAQLRHLARGDANGAGKYYKLGNDIVLNDTSYEDWYLRSGLKNWIKGKDANGNIVSDTMNGREMGEFLFRSNFDGDGHTISGLYINYEGTGHMETSGTGYKRAAAGWALFPSVNGATIKNLKLKDVYIKSNVSKTSGDQPHGYGALIGYCYYDGATVSNVEIENVKYDLQSPSQAYTAYRVGVGSIIGYAGGPITATDCIVKNISGKAVNKYFTSTGKPGSAGSIIGFVHTGYKHTLTNILSIGRMNPLSANVADPAFVTTNTDTAIPLSMPIRTGSAATNVYAIGDVSILANSNITKAVDEAAFKSTYLDTFYSNLGGSTNWSNKNASEVPYLKLFPPVEDIKEKAAEVLCDFSDYTPSTSAKAQTNWTIVTASGNQSLKGDFTDTGLNANNFGFIVGSYNYGVHGPLVPGKIYKLEFKAKADENATMDYALYNGSTYAASSRDYHVVSGGYDAFGRRTVNLTTGWQTFTTYFTFDSYTNTVDAGQGTRRPFFFIQPNNTIWGNSVYFDDFVITSCEGTSFAQSANHYYEPTLGDNGDDVTLIADPEKENYIFDGWYTDSELTMPFNADSDKISDGLILYEKWSEAITEAEFDSLEICESGADVYSQNLYTRVTSLNSYPINFDVVNNSAGNVVIGFATASDDDFEVANNVIWQKDITEKSGGTFSVLLTPNTRRENGVKGDALYFFAKYTDGADISIDNFSIINAPTVRNVEFDVNSDNAFNILDLISIKKMTIGRIPTTWLGDLDGDNVAALADDLTTIVNALIGKSNVVTSKLGRTLVWNDEFDGTSINSTNWTVKYPDDKSLIVSSDSANYNYSDGKLNLNITRNGSTYDVPYDLITRNKMSFKYGYIELSAKMNYTPGQWSAFWLSGIKGDNTYQGEIDIFETVSNGIKPDIHSWDNGTRKNHLGDAVTSYTLDADFDKTVYHTYGFEWDSTSLKFYVDDYCYYTLSASDITGDDDYDGVLDQYYCLLLSNSTLTTAMSAENSVPRMSIDYVRLYQKSGESINVGVGE